MCRSGPIQTVSRISSQSSNLDLLRAVAVLLVLLGHFVEYSGVGTEFFRSFKTDTDQLAHFAVLMFFIHTSLVLMMSIDRLVNSVEEGLFWRFYVRRAARIYPLAILVVCVCYLFRIPQFPGKIVCAGTFFEKILNFLLLQNIGGACVVSGPLWSLPYEVQMYLVLPVAYLFGSKLRRPAMILLLGFLVWYVSRKTILGDLLRFAPWFFMGVYAFFRRRKLIMPSWGFGVSLFCLLAGVTAIHRYMHHYVSGWLLFGLATVFCHVLPLFRDSAYPLLIRPAAFIAKYSYGIYLVHTPLMWLIFVEFRGMSQPLQIMMFLFLVMCCSVLLYHVLEAPIIRLGLTLSKPRSICAPMTQTMEQYNAA